MSRLKLLRGGCQSCGRTIEFMADRIGTVARCPNCGNETELLLAAPPKEPSQISKLAVSAGIAIVVLVLSLLATIIGLKHFERKAAERKGNASSAPVLQTNAVISPPPATNKN
jgi:hypothetical protein